MNRKGSLFLGIALALFIYVSGVLIMPFIADDIATFRVDLDCYNSAISGGNKITCLYGGALMPYFIWFFISLAVGLIIGGLKG